MKWMNLSRNAAAGRFDNPLLHELAGRARCPQRAGLRTGTFETVVGMERRPGEDTAPYLRSAVEGFDVRRLFWSLVVTVFAILAATAHSAESEEAQKINTAVEALTRLEDINLEEKPTIKTAILRVLEKTRGTANFVKLVRYFKLTDQNTGLLEVAIKNPADEIGVEAIRLVLEGKDFALLRNSIENTNADSAAKTVEALGNAKQKQVVPLLEPLVTDESRPATVRRAAVRALAQTEDGAAALLKFAKEDKLPENLKFLAASELNSVRWPEIKAEAAKILPLPAGQNSQPLPPVAELVKMKGDPLKGAEVFSARSNRLHQMSSRRQ
jgi:uncharacterized protein (UPF0147 family)